MKSKILVFILSNMLLYYTLGDLLDIMIFKRLCGTSYAGYYFLLTFVLLFAFALKKPKTLTILVYLIIPAISLIISIVLYRLSYNISLSKHIYLSPVILQSTFSFFVYLIAGIFSIGYAEHLNKW
jgi:hypothetical protein